LRAVARTIKSSGSKGGGGGGGSGKAGGGGRGKGGGGSSSKAEQPGIAAILPSGRIVRAVDMKRDDIPEAVLDFNQHYPTAMPLRPPPGLEGEYPGFFEHLPDTHNQEDEEEESDQMGRRNVDLAVAEVCCGEREGKGKGAVAPKLVVTPSKCAAEHRMCGRTQAQLVKVVHSVSNARCVHVDVCAGDACQRCT
jgi:hypothetical protein